MSNKILLRELSDRVIGAAFRVHTRLGCRLPESVYKFALDLELESLSISHVLEESYPVYYNDRCVGRFYSDIVVDNSIILELKSAPAITKEHYAQLFTYLRTSGINLGYIINFGTKSMTFKRLVL